MAPDDPSDTPSHAGAPNALIHETSPYLLQHAYNPVQWQPWGADAIEQARLEDKPIFLSVGYSTCYWCHVMERESFEDDAVADYLNTHFIPVKVDREERPDVDDIYMTAVQVMSGRGGWPMSVFIEPVNMEPFFAGTYFPTHDVGNTPGFYSLLESVVDAWTDPKKRPQLEGGADRLATAVRQRVGAIPTGVQPDRSVVDSAVSQIMSSYDSTDGGYGGAPKFPMPSWLELLLVAGWDQPEVQASIMHTLDRMAMGGMYDQVGGGFHRYSTDAQWLVPHFEKMLYDNGQLAGLYARVGVAGGNGFHRAIAAEICDYVLRDMRDPSGAFWSAQDAEANAREGATYIWTPDSFEAALRAGGHDDADIAFARSAFGVGPEPNYIDPHHPQDPTWVLHLPEQPSALARSHGMSGRDFHMKLLPIMATLKAARDARDQPGIDDKVLASWNGLMIEGLADTGRLLDRPDLVQAAVEAATAIQTRMWSQDGLKRSMRGDTVAIDAFLEDYALLAGGALAVHRATGDEAWLQWAQALIEQATTRFWTEGAGWYDMPDDDPSLFVRGRSLHDGAMPCGTSAMLRNFVTLGERTGDAAWFDRARSTAATIGSVLKASPRSMPVAIAAVHRLNQLQPIADDLALAPVTRGAVTASVQDMPSTLAEGETARMTVTLKMQPSWHVTLPTTTSEFAMPVRIEAGDASLSVVVDWPEGHAFSGPAGTMQVLSGTAEIPLTLTRTQASAAPVSIIVTFQACDDRVCEPPVTHRFGADG